MKKLIFSTIIITLLIFTSCSSDTNIPSTSNLTLNLTGLENLGTTYQYEGWIVVNGAPVSTGTFTINDAGTPSITSFVVNSSQLSAATRFIVSIEPNPDPSTDPSNTKILAGDFNENNAALTSDATVIDSQSSIGTLGASTGKLILATPTNGADNNEDSGVWFIDNSGTSNVAGLSLPTLSAGWKYEGWVVFNGTPVSTGTFLTAAGADSNATTSPYKGTVTDGPAFPGEDFITGTAAGVTFPTDLRGTTVVVSVEPDPDNSTNPFKLKPLKYDVASDAEVHKTLTMIAGPVTSLSGSVTR